MAAGVIALMQTDPNLHAMSQEDPVAGLPSRPAHPQHDQCCDQSPQQAVDMGAASGVLRHCYREAV
jgi:hypothetical protein